MIDLTAFNDAFRSLSTRFGRAYDANQAAAYHEFLDDHLDTPQFQAAARTIWATAKWWPRPADFLMVGSGDEWHRVTLWMDPAASPQKRDEHWGALSTRAQTAVKRIGGLEALQGLSGKDALRVKAAWEAAYEQATASAVLSLPLPKTGLRALRGGAA